MINCPVTEAVSGRVGIGTHVSMIPSPGKLLHNYVMCAVFFFLLQGILKSPEEILEQESMRWWLFFYRFVLSIPLPTLMSLKAGFCELVSSRTPLTSAFFWLGLANRSQENGSWRLGEEIDQVTSSMLHFCFRPNLSVTASLYYSDFHLVSLLHEFHSQWSLELSFFPLFLWLYKQQQLSTVVSFWVPHSLGLFPSPHTSIINSFCMNHVVHSDSW